MFEISSQANFKDHQCELPVVNYNQLMLPLINKKPQSRQQFLTDNENEQKQKLILPTITTSQKQIDSLQDIQFNKFNLDNINFHKISIIRQVKNRVNYVLGQIPQINKLQLSQPFGGNDQDFQAKVNQNKQILKQYKLKNQGQYIIQHQKQVPESRHDLQNRNEQNYDKLKQPQDISTQNRYNNKKKSVQKQKTPAHQSQSAIKELKLKQNIIKENKKQIKRTASKKNKGRSMSFKTSCKNILLNHDSQNLFDHIQDYLQNPKQNKKLIHHQFNQFAILKNKKNIQLKIKSINHKLGIADHDQSKKNKNNNFLHLLNSSARDWRRVEFKHEKVHYQNSNFDKQLQRINSLQQKNSLCLQKYLHNQKLLLALQFRKKQFLSKFNIDSK